MSNTCGHNNELYLVVLVEVLIKVVLSQQKWRLWWQNKVVWVLLKKFNLTKKINFKIYYDVLCAFSQNVGFVVII